MRVIVTKNYEEMSKKVAQLIAAQLLLKPNSVLGLATGSTPIGAYKNLIDMHKALELDFSKAYSINLDEYVGLSEESDQSYRYFMNENLFNHININKDNTYVPNGLELDEKKACSNYDAILEKLGGIDIQLLGIGHNGHIGFNEPSDSFSVGTNCVALAQSTIDANARFFSSIDEVPRKAYTMGMAGIMQAKTVVIAASGQAKADIVKQAIYGKVSPEVPASILQLHANCIFVLDEAAASKL